MLGYKIMGAGMPGLAVQAMCMDAVTDLTATGTTQTTALSLTSTLNGITTTSSGSGVILSAAATLGDAQKIYNGGANPLKVYPPAGASINGLPTNAPFLLSTRTAAECCCLSATQWFAILSA
jgi:hypothetical protein